jgi:Integrase core domain
VPQEADKPLVFLPADLEEPPGDQPCVVIVRRGKRIEPMAALFSRSRIIESNNGPCYIAGELGEWLETRSIKQVHGAPGHPQTQGKIERWHQTLKNRILLENYFFSEDLEAQIAAFVDHYNHRRYHESISTHPCRRLLRTWPNHPVTARKDQTRHNQTAALATQIASRLNPEPDEPETPIFPNQSGLKYLMTDRHIPRSLPSYEAIMPS